MTDDLGVAISETIEKSFDKDGALRSALHKYFAGSSGWVALSTTTATVLYENAGGLNFWVEGYEIFSDDELLDNIITIFDAATALLCIDAARRDKRPVADLAAYQANPLLVSQARGSGRQFTEKCYGQLTTTPTVGKYVYVRPIIKVDPNVIE